MKTKRCIRMWWAVLLLSAFAARDCASAAELHLEMLKSGTSVFSNVTVYGRTDTDIFIRHAQGFGNIKISNLDNATCRALGLATQDETDSRSGEAMATAASKFNMGSLAGFQRSLEANSLRLASTLRPTPAFLAAVLAGMALAYLFYCYCLKLICVKAGSEPGFLIWLPVLQMFPLLRAAGMSGWWFLASFVPLLNLVACLLWCVKIARRRGKGILTVLFLILPVTNILALLYLAFSGGGATADEDSPRPRSDPVAAQHVFEGLSN
jgi:hypothetical protein